MSPAISTPGSRLWRGALPRPARRWRPCVVLLWLALGLRSALAMDLVVTASAPVPVTNAGAAAIVILNVTNLGPGSVSQVFLTNQLSPHTVFLSASATQGSCTQQAGRVVCSAGSLANGGRFSVTLTVQAAPGTNACTAVVAAAEADPTPANNSATASLTGTQAAAPLTNPEFILLDEINAGPGSVYPSLIQVSGLTGMVHKVTVTLHGLTHSNPDDLDILLVSPDGRNGMLMSDCGLDNGINEVVLTLDDAAAVALPDSDPPIATGTYRPANYGSISLELLDPPAPPRPYGSGLTTFQRGNPNGTWRLFVFDDTPEDGGYLADGWTLRLVTSEPIADLAVAQTAAPSPVPAGSNLTVTVSVTNHGPATTSATLVDTLPAGVTFLSASATQGSCAQAAGVVTCPLGTLAPGGVARVTLLLRPGQPGTFFNSVSVTGSTFDPGTTNNIATLSVPVLPVADLGLAAAAPASLLLGQPFSLAFTLTNRGPQAAGSVWLIHPPADGLAFLSATASQGSCTLTNGLLTCILGTLAPQSAAVVQVQVRPESAGTFPHEAGVVTSAYDPILTNNEATATTTVVPAADLVLALAPAPATLLFGEDWTQTVLVTNRGPSPVSAVVTSMLPARLRFVSAFPTPGACAFSNGLLRCDLGLLAPGQIGAVTVVATAIGVGAVTNAFAVTGNEIDPLSTNNEAVVVANILPRADLAVGMVAPSTPIWVGEEALTVFAVTNRGPNPAADVVFTSELPPALSFISLVPDQGFCSVTGKTATCRLGPIAAGDVVGIVLRARGFAPGLFQQSGRATTTAVDLDPTNNVAIAGLRVVAPAVELAAGPIPIPDSGPAVGYPSTIQVSGLTAAVFRVRVTLTNLTHSYPGDLDVLLVGPSGQACVLMSDAGGGTDVTNVSLTLDVDSPARLPDDAVLSPGFFQPTDHEPGDPFPAPAPAGPHAADLDVFRNTNPNGTWSLYLLDDAAKDAGSLGGWSLSIAVVQPIADLQLVSTLSTNPVPVGSTFLSTFAVTNHGPAPATEVQLTQTLDPSMAFLFATSSRGSCTNEGGLLRCRLGTLPVGGQAVIQVGTLPTAPAVFTQFASLTAAELDLQPTNNTALAVIESELPPVITRQPVGFTVVNGEPAELVAEASGTGPLRLQWERDGVALPGATNAVLAFAATTATDRGSYRLRASNRVGLVRSEPAFLRVISQPVIFGLTDQVIDEDTTGGPLPFTLVDQESDPATLVLTAHVFDTSVVDPAGLLFGGSGAQRTLRVTPRAQASGQTRIEVVATDPDGLSATNGFLLTVLPANDPPTLSAVPDVASLEDVPVGVAFTVNDPDSGPDALFLAVTSSDEDLFPPAQTVLTGSGTERLLTLVPATNRFGSALLTLLARDDSNAVSTVTFRVTVAPVNDPPTLDPVADLFLSEDAAPVTVTLRGLSSGASDEDQRLRVEAFSAQPALLSPPSIQPGASPDTATLRLTPATNAAGSVLITVTVTDGGASNAATSRAFTVHLAPVNDPPRLSLPPSITMSEDEVLAIPVELVDPDDAPETILLAAAGSSNPALLDPAALQVGGQGSQRHLILAPRPNAHGVATVTLSGRDPGGASITNPIVVTVLPVDDRPTLNPIPDSYLPANASQHVVALGGITAGAPDEVQPLAVTATSSNPALIPAPAVAYSSPATTGTLTFQPLTGSTGTAVVVVSVSDGNSTVSRQFTVWVTPDGGGGPLSISPIGPVTTLEDTPVAAAFSIGDDQVPASLLTLTATSSNPALIDAGDITFDGAAGQRTVQLSPRPDQVGTANITVTVSDGVETRSATFPLTVQPVNDRPTLDFIPAFVVNTSRGNPAYTLIVNGVSAGAPNEGQSLTVTAVSSNPALLPNPAVSYQGGTSATLALRPASNTPGSAEVTVTVNDGGASNNTVSRTFLANFKAAANAPPVITSPGNLSTPEDTPLSAVPFTVTDAQTPAGSLIVTAVSSNPNLLPPGNVQLGGSGSARTLTLIPAPNQSGVSTLTLTAYDTEFGATNVSFLVTVNPVNDPPVLSAIPDRTAPQGRTVLVPFTVGDVETRAGDLLVEATTDNPALLPPLSLRPGGSGTNRALQVFPASGQGGIASVTVRVSDGAAVATSTFTLTLEPVVGPPTLSHIDPLFTPEDTPSSPVLFTVGDDTTPPGDLIVTATSSQPALIAPGDIVLGGSGASRTLAFTPRAGAHGTALLTLTVTDTTSLSTQLGVPVTVVPVNDPPLLPPLADVFVNEGDGPLAIALTGLSPGDGEPGQYLAVTATTDTNLLALVAVDYPGLGPSATLRLQPVPALSGLARVTVVANDGQPSNHLASRVFAVHINAAPRIEYVPDQSTLVETPTASIQLRLADADSPLDEVTVAATSASPLVTAAGFAFSGIGAERTLVITPATNQAGTAEITLVATDPRGATATRRFQLTVLSRNVPPTLDLPDNLVANPGSGPVQVALTGIGPGAPGEADLVRLEANSSDPAAFSVVSIDYVPGSTTGTLTLLPGGGAGSASVTVVADDGRPSSNRTTRVFTATLNTPPTLPPLTNQRTREDMPTEPQAFVIADAEHAAATLVVSALASPGAGVSFQFGGDGSNRTLSVLGPTNAAGTVRVTVTVTDPLGLSASNSFDVHIDPVPDPLTLVQQPQSTEGVLGGTASFTVRADSAVPVRYQWRHGDADLPGATNAMLALSNLLASSAGFYSVRVTNDDGAFELSQPAELRLDPRPRITSLVREGGQASVFFLTFPGSSNTLEFATPLAATNWLPLGSLTATNDIMQLADPAASNTFRFYRIRRN
ncbi:MAG: hypothetical protein RJA22_2705 [Verrucomicrobiota bacterium]